MTCNITNLYCHQALKYIFPGKRFSTNLDSHLYVVHVEIIFFFFSLQHNIYLFNFLFQKPENQKLIYSGKLLGDELPLSDVLKTYAGTENNTIHLVCSAGSSIRAKTVASRSVQTTTPDLHSQSSVTSNQHYQSSSISNGMFVLECNTFTRVYQKSRFSIWMTHQFLYRTVKMVYLHTSYVYSWKCLGKTPIIPFSLSLFL